MKKSLSLLLFLLAVNLVLAQTRSTIADGSWTTSTNWQGGNTPGTSNVGGTVNVNNNMTVSGSYSQPNGNLVIAANKTMTVNGDFEKGIGGGGGLITVNGTLYITGSMTINAPVLINPGGKLIVDGDVTVISSSYLTIGTNAATANWAEMIVRGNLKSKTSGDITLEQNARLAVFKNLESDGGGGVIVNVKNGAEMYIHKDIIFPGPGGNDDVVNGNGATPRGFYVNGTVTATGGGSDVSSNRGNLAFMQTNDPSFYTWVNGIPNTPLPVVLVSFQATANGKAIDVEWATSLEHNFDYFELQRAGDDLGFVTISTQKGKGESQAKTSYGYADTTPLDGKNYYRLKSIDLDGSFEYSNVVVAVGKVSRGISMYPNPVREGRLITVELNTDNAERGNVQVLDGAGMLVYNTEVMQGATGVQLPDSVEPGMYFLRITSPSAQATLKLIVQ